MGEYSSTPGDRQVDPTGREVTWPRTSGHGEARAEGGCEEAVTPVVVEGGVAHRCNESSSSSGWESSP